MHRNTSYKDDYLEPVKRLQVESSIVHQKNISKFFYPITYLLVCGWMKYWMRYRIKNINYVRSQYRSIIQKSESPVLICSNHLTLIDSLILIWGLGSYSFYKNNFNFFPWNLPEKNNFYHKPLSRLLCYLGKSVPVVRGGSVFEVEKTRKKIAELASLNESIMIFPEGTRSRYGVIMPELTSYAAGTILLSHPQYRVICVYIRGDNQISYGDYPVRNENFQIELHELHLMSDQKGLRAIKDLSHQIIKALKKLETNYFNKNDFHRK